MNDKNKFNDFCSRNNIKSNYYRADYFDGLIQGSKDFEYDKGYQKGYKDIDSIKYPKERNN